MSISEDGLTHSYIKDHVKYLDHLHKFILEIEELPSDFFINASSQIDIVFTRRLTPNQINILNTAINAYIPPQQISIPFKTDTFVLSNNIISSFDYSVIGTYFYNVTDEILSSFTIISSVKGAISYKIRIYDAINSKTLCETVSLNNNNLQIIKLTDILNIPKNDTLLEVHCQVSGDNTCNVKLVQINFDKIL